MLCDEHYEKFAILKAGATGLVSQSTNKRAEIASAQSHQHVKSADPSGLALRHRHAWPLPIVEREHMESAAIVVILVCEERD